MDVALAMMQKRVSFNVIREKTLIENVIPGLPENEVFKIVSFGGFSSIGFVRLVADRVGINHLFASSLRIGKKHITSLDVMHRQGKLDKASFIVGGIMKNDSAKGQEYGYFDILTETCKRNGWDLAVRANHSKVLLFDTPAGKYVLETSSNLNENPSIEQFSFERSADLYAFYFDILSTIVEGGAAR